MGFVLATLLACSLIIAFIRPNQDCEHSEDVNVNEEAVTSPPEAIATNGDPFPWNHINLPDSIVPLRYNLILHPNMTAMYLKGQMEVIFTVVKETNLIVFHGKNISIDVVMVKNRSNDREILTRNTLYYPHHQQISIELKNYLQPGNNYSLALRYEGKIRTDLEGLYLSSYMTPGGIKR